jgi:hypothetical protein
MLTVPVTARDRIEGTIAEAARKRGQRHTEITAYPIKTGLRDVPTFPRMKRALDECRFASGISQPS